jgi:hypothetical protein
MKFRRILYRCSFFMNRGAPAANPPAAHLHLDPVADLNLFVHDHQCIWLTDFVNRVFHHLARVNTRTLEVTDKVKALRHVEFPFSAKRIIRGPERRCEQTPERE